MTKGPQKEFSKAAQCLFEAARTNDVEACKQSYGFTNDKIVRIIKANTKALHEAAVSESYESFEAMLQIACCQDSKYLERFAFHQDNDLWHDILDRADNDPRLNDAIKSFENNVGQSIDQDAVNDYFSGRKFAPKNN